MSLIPTLINYARQSQLDDENKRRYEEEMALRRELQAEKIREKVDAEKRRESVISGAKELAEIGNAISEQSLQKTMLEERLNGVMASGGDPAMAGQILRETRALGDAIKGLEGVQTVKKAELMYRSVDAGFAKAKALDLVDAMNGIKPSKDSAGMATVRRKQVVGTDEEGNPIEETVTYKVPSSQYSQYQNQGGQSYASASQIAPAYMGTSPSLSPLGNATPDEMTPEYAASSLNLLQNNVSQMQPTQQATMPVQNAQPQQDLTQARNEAIQILNNPNIPPDKKQRVRERAAQLGITL